MKIVDLRPWPVKWAVNRWENIRTGCESDFQQQGRLSPGGLYGRLMDAVMNGRVRRRPTAPPGGPFLMSVGNLALGGTGKTPVVGTLAMDLADRGLRGAILTRGFGSDLSGPLIVAADDPGAGDEARWHAGRLVNSGWTVVQARYRPAGLEFLLEKFRDLDVVLLEDAHQTARLARHLDLVILDSWSRGICGDKEMLEPRTGSVFPFGPWRESACGSDRADVLLVESRTEIPEISSSGQPVASFSRTVVLRDVADQSGAPAGAHSWVGLSGIAHPAAFERSVAEIVGSPAEVVIRCSDHVRYTPALVDRIRRIMARSGGGRLITTAKDWVKLEAYWPPNHSVQVADLVIEWGKRNALPDLIEERVQALSARL